MQGCANSLQESASFSFGLGNIGRYSQRTTVTIIVIIIIVIAAVIIVVVVVVTAVAAASTLANKDVI